MPETLIDRWLSEKWVAEVKGLRLRPKENRDLPGVPLSIQKGQATAFYLVDQSSKEWVLKKFRRGCELDPLYLSAIRTLVPVLPGTEAATTREVLSSGSLKAVAGAPPNCRAELSAWIDSTVLMQKVSGMAWGDLADDLAEGLVQFARNDRIHIARSLCRIVNSLEDSGCSHRDLSSGNLFLNPKLADAYLIDWDSFYHPRLAMPSNTTTGTPGYVAPFIPRHGPSWDGSASWCPFADRYALALLTVEILATTQGSPLTGDGGLFDQRELERRGGPQLQAIESVLAREFPSANKCLSRALQATSFSACPSPREWTEALEEDADRPSAATLPLAQKLGHVRSLVAVAMADDGVLSYEEEKQIREAAANFQIPPDQVEKIIQDEKRKHPTRAPATRTGMGSGTPVLDVSKRQFDFRDLRTGSTTWGSFTISNTGGGILQGPIKSNKPWLRPLQSQIDTTRHRQDISFKVDTTGLPLGVRDRGEIEIRSNGGADTIVVNLSVEAPPVAMGRFRKVLFCLGFFGGGLFGYALYHSMARGSSRDAVAGLAGLIGIIGATVIGARIRGWAGGFGGFFLGILILGAFQEAWPEGFSIISWAITYGAFLHAISRPLFMAKQSKKKASILAIALAAALLSLLVIICGDFVAGLDERHKAGQRAAALATLPTLVGQWRGTVRNEAAELLIGQNSHGSGILGSITYNGVKEELVVDVQSDGSIDLKGVSYKRVSGSGNFWLDTFHASLSSDATSMSGSYTDRAGNRGNWQVSKVSNLRKATAAGGGTGSGPGSPSRPVIASASPIIPAANQNIAITGRGFGNQGPYNGNSPYILITDLTRNWNAGNTGGWDLVTLNVAHWTDTQILISGFAGAYGGGWSLKAGDLVRIQVWNPQTHAGPATITARVASSGNPKPNTPSQTPQGQAATYTNPPPTRKSSRPQGNDQVAAQLLDQAQTLFENRQYSAALARCNTLLQRDPKNLQALELRDRIQKAIDILKP